MIRNLAEKFNGKKAAKPLPTPIIDLDAIVSESKYVRFQGVTHEIKPIEVQEFFALANAYANIESIRQQENLTVDQIVDGYYSIIFPVCPTITKEMIRKGGLSQIASLMQFIDDHITGKVTEEKKKNLVMIPSPNNQKS